MKYAAKKLNNGLKPFTWELFFSHWKRDKLFGLFMFGVEEPMK